MATGLSAMVPAEWSAATRGCRHRHHNEGWRRGPERTHLCPKACTAVARAQRVTTHKRGATWQVHTSAERLVQRRHALRLRR